MRRGFRRGQDIADALRIEIRDLDKDDLGPRSSPGSPDSVASSASPTKTTFAPGAAPTATQPPPGVTATGTKPTAAITTSPATGPTAQPVIATSVISSTTLVSSVIPTGAIASGKTAGAPSSTVRQQRPDGTAVPANGIAEKGGSNGGGGGGPAPMSKAAIALGVIGGVGFLVAIVFIIWKLWNRKKRAKDNAARAELVGTANNNPPRPGVGPNGLPRSDSSALGSIMGHVYRAEEGGNTSQVGGTYMDEKRRGSQDDLLPRAPEPAAQRNESPVGSWLSRQSSTMLNPLTARASMTSSAAGEVKRAQMAQQPRPDDSVSQFGGEEAAPTMDPRFQPPVPAMPQQFQQQMPAQQLQQQATGEYYYPIAIDPQKVPPPPAPQRYSVAETNRTSGTWNTWGVQQHRPGEANKPKGWKAKLAGRS
ncbi:hypothetical protein PG995_012276 [Apiospora arundinis]